MFLPIQVACYLLGQLDNNLIKEDTAATILSTSPIEGLVQQCAKRATDVQTWTLRELNKSVQLNPASVVGRWNAGTAFLFNELIVIVNKRVMFRTRINEGMVGIVYKNGSYNRVEQAGTFWLMPNESVETCKVDTVYGTFAKLDIMLKDDRFRAMVELLELNDSQIALQFVNGNFVSVLKAGRYFYFKGFANIKFVVLNLSKVEITEGIDLAVLLRSEVAAYIRAFSVASYEEGLLFVDGKFQKKLTKGTYYFWKNPVTVEVLKADLRQLQMEISGQEILTLDKAALRVNFYAQYRVVDTEVALLNNKDFEKQLYILVQLVLREFVGTKTLDELLESKDSVGQFVADMLKGKAAKLGVEIVNSGMRDVILPGEMKEIMNQVLVAQKQAQANTIMRREETASTRSLLNTAKLMEDNEMLFKLKEMEYVEKIASKIGEITVSGNGQVLDQLRDIFSSRVNK